MWAGLPEAAESAPAIGPNCPNPVTGLCYVPTKNGGQFDRRDMGQNRDAQRLQRLVKTRVHAAVLVDRPKGFARAKDSRVAAGVEADAGRPPAFLSALSGRFPDDRRDNDIESNLSHGVFLAVTAGEFVVADRSRITGRPRRVLRRDPIGEVAVGWLDDERHGLRSRIVILEFSDRRWSLLATPWKRLIPDDALRLIEGLGTSAHRVPRPEIDGARG